MVYLKGFNICLWGVILMLHSVGTSFGAFFALRFLLGLSLPSVHSTVRNEQGQGCARAV